MQLKDVLNILQERLANHNKIQVIKQLNINNSIRIQSGPSTTKAVPISIGIGQGDRPEFDTFHMDCIIHRVKGLGRGYRMRQTDFEFKISCYADGAVLIAKNEKIQHEHIDT